MEPEIQCPLEGSIEKVSLLRKHKPFYGYRILAVAFWGVFIFAGCGIAAFSLFVKPLQSDFGWGRAEIMVAFTIYYLLTGMVAPFAGKLVDRYGARYVISAGAFVGGLGFVSLNLMHDLWHFYGGYAVIGLGMAATGHVPASALVSNWFKKRRGTAIGIMR